MAIDFGAALDRKYDIQQQEAAARSGLEGAQAQQITASTPFENALRAAQTNQANATAGTIAPLAQSSIASTQAGIGQTQAQTGLIGAQTRDINADLSPIGEQGSRLFLQQLRQGGARPTTGTYDSNGNYIPAQGFAFGTANVPAPGQTVTSGSWTGPTVDPSPAPAPLPPTTLTGTELRARLGLGVKAYAKGTSRVPKGKANAPIMAGGEITGKAVVGPKPPMVPPFDPGAMSTATGMAVGSMPGLEGLLQAAMGASRVPGRPSPGVDSVPAMLSPGEAVVNPAAVKHIPGGRATITKANAKGAAEMQGRGAPPAPKMKHKGAPPPRAVGQFLPGPPPAAQPPAAKL